jgi:hypothetical protein
MGQLSGIAEEWDRWDSKESGKRSSWSEKLRDTMDCLKRWDWPTQTDFLSHSANFTKWSSDWFRRSLGLTLTAIEQLGTKSWVWFSIEMGAFIFNPAYTYTGFWPPVPTTKETCHVCELDSAKPWLWLWRYRYVCHRTKRDRIAWAIERLKHSNAVQCSDTNQRNVEY